MSSPKSPKVSKAVPPESPDQHSPASSHEGHISTDITGKLDATESRSLDSDYDSFSDIESDTTSLASAVTDFKYENGRRYHSYQEGKYWAPNDEQQNDQLDIFHHVYNLSLGGRLFRAPIGDHPHRILDIGTGTGIWVINMADQFPSAVVTGNDLSPIQPTWVPPNCKFEVDDFTLDWTYPHDHFDFIHARAIYGAVADWPRLLEQIYTHTKPGGWFESVETSIDVVSDDGSITLENDIIKRWVEGLEEAAKILGKPFRISDKTAGWIADAGFINVKEDVYKVPIGPWPKDKKHKEIGTYNLLNMLKALEGFTVALYTRILKWEMAEITVLLAGVRAAMTDKKRHGYFTMHVSYGQKPAFN